MVLLLERWHMNDAMKMLIFVEIESDQLIGISLGRQQRVEGQFFVPGNDGFLFLEFDAGWKKPFFSDFDGERDKLCDL